MADSSKEQGVPAFRWEDPGADQMPRSPLYRKLLPMIDRLGEQPGVWARLLDYPKPAAAGGAAQRAREHFPHIAFTSCRTTDGGSRLYGALPVDDDGEPGEESDSEDADVIDFPPALTDEQLRERARARTQQV